jgi:hypothetical protein
MNIDQHAASAHTPPTDPSRARAENLVCPIDTAESAARDHRMLEELAGIGLDIARSLRMVAQAQAARAMAESGAAPPASIRGWASLASPARSA